MWFKRNGHIRHKPKTRECVKLTPRKMLLFKAGKEPKERVNV